MKTCKYLLEIEMPDECSISTEWIKEIIDTYGFEYSGRQIINVNEVGEGVTVNGEIRQSYKGPYGLSVYAKVSNKDFEFGDKIIANVWKKQ